MSFESLNNRNGSTLLKTKSAKATYFNQISSLPMFEKNRLAFYNTTYRDEYQKRSKFADLSNESNNVQHNYYDYNELSKKLDDRNRTRMPDVSKYLPDDAKNSKNDLASESKYSFTDYANIEGFDNAYKRPKVPGYIKRDSSYHTNAEKNITYLQTHYGYVIPSVEQRTPKRSAYRSNVITTQAEDNRQNLVHGFGSNEVENFLTNKSTESHAAFQNPPPVNQLNRSYDASLNNYSSSVFKGQGSHSANPNSPRHAEKIISYIKTNNGSMVGHVPTYEYEKNDTGNSNLESQNWPYNNHMKIKLHNPINQLKRNSSTLSLSNI